MKKKGQKRGHDYPKKNEQPTHARIRAPRKKEKKSSKEKRRLMQPNKKEMACGWHVFCRFGHPLI